jgi:catechol 2,3-dioxygenase-like lactoylglutathione lyase family enzyme
MTSLRMDHVVVVVEDMAAAQAFFTELGMELEGTAPIEGAWVDRVNGIEGLRVQIAMMRTPDGLGKLELTTFTSPPVISGDPNPAPPNTLGLRSVMFEVEDVDDTVARLSRLGGELIGEIVQYEELYRLCYLRGPAGIIVALAESLGG